LKAIRILALLLFVLWIPGCKSSVEPEKEKIRPASTQQESPPAEEEVAEPQDDRGPDGGLGTLDYSRDAKEASEAESKQAEKALEDTE